MNKIHQHWYNGSLLPDAKHVYFIYICISSYDAMRSIFIGVYYMIDMWRWICLWNDHIIHLKLHSSWNRIIRFTYDFPIKTRRYILRILFSEADLKTMLVEVICQPWSWVSYLIPQLEVSGVKTLLENFCYTV